MWYDSTRAGCPPVRFSQAVRDGLAPDGGLYVPRRLDPPPPATLDALESVGDIARVLLAPFLAGDPLREELDEICAEAFDFPVPLRELPDGETAVLELFCGPTAAFKDFGARFLAACLARIDAARGQTVLVATSGDTGAAIAAAFDGRPEFRVVVLFPLGGVSARQQHQLACWGDNVTTLAVRGSFDDCQALVKQAFADPACRAAARLTSANSISIGRLLPQMVYHAAAALWYRRRHGASPALAVPTGNLGNAVAALMARRLGLPIRHVGLASNANQAVPDYLVEGEYRPRPSQPTLASAMDVGAPSNMERLRWLFPDVEELRRSASALAVDDPTIRRVIAEGPARWQSVWCPHTATAVRLRERAGDPHWVVAATAHPAKFDGVVEPLIGRSVPLPESLQRLLERPVLFREIERRLDALRETL